MARVRLLTDTPEGRAVSVVTVPPDRAADLVGREQAERVVDRTVPIERT